MRFLVDECLFMQIVHRLRSDGHDVEWTGERYGGADDHALLALAVQEQAIIITEDRDFGELIFRDRQPSRGVLRVKVGEFGGVLDDVAAEVAKVVRDLGDTCEGYMTVIEPGRVRRRQLPS